MKADVKIDFNKYATNKEKIKINNRLLLCIFRCEISQVYKRND